MTSFAMTHLDCGLSVPGIFYFHTQIPQMVDYTQRVSFSITSSEGAVYAFGNESFDKQTRNQNK